MKTKGGHIINDFKKLDNPEVRYSGAYIAIYEGTLRNDHTFNQERCTWDKDGKVVNRNLPKYDIDITELP